uniref:Uncharacterized protein n=1 Tax=Arundo donax TaxID=35708 RepID=A0A0A9PR51_ARUDO
MLPDKKKSIRPVQKLKVAKHILTHAFFHFTTETKCMFKQDRSDTNCQTGGFQKGNDSRTTICAQLMYNHAFQPSDAFMSFHPSNFNRRIMSCT